MIKVLNLMMLVFLFATACRSGKADLQTLMSDPASGLQQEKHVGNVVVKFTYLPECWDRMYSQNREENREEMCFKVNVHLEDKNAGNQKTESPAASYGLDSIFQLVLNHDTIAPVLAQRIANGNINGMEYLVIFERKPLKAIQQLAFVYKDWLFTSTRLVFPLQKNYLQKSDSLSCRL